jgi:hypothetical protein
MKKLKSFIEKKLQEFKAFDPMLAQFCLECCVNQNIEKLKNDLKLVLDEDWEEFCLLLWRLLVYETEAKAIGL